MIGRSISALLLLCLVTLAPFANAASSNVVMSQVYGGGGANTGTPAYTNDYVELFNTSTVAVPIAGWSLQYGSSSGNFGNSGNVYTFPAGTSIPAGRYLLVKLGAAGTAGATFTSDLTSGGLSMAAASGKVALVNSGTALGCGATATPCALPDSRIVDVVSWGASNNGEGGTTVNNGTGLNSSNGAIRKSNGCQDTDNNRDDFTVATVAGGLVPRTAASPAQSCGVSNLAPSITAPADPIATKNQDAAPFTVSLSGNDDGGVYVWGATAGSGVASVSVSGGQGTPNATYTVALQSGFSGTATFTATLSDTVNAAVTRTVNIAVTPVIPNNAPSINAFANPVATVAQDAAPFTVNLSGLDDNDVFQWSAIAGSGVSNVAVSGGQGTANATYTVTLEPGFSGTASFTARLSDTVNPIVTSNVTFTVTPAPLPPLDHIVISQVYGGGGNGGAAFQNDFIELYNPTTSEVDLGGWTVQYASATGTGVWQIQPLGGIMQPGEYYLVALATNGAVGAALPAANISGTLNMSGTNGKVALVRGGDPLEGCPIGDELLVDLVGYGTTANCREGATNAPTASNATSLFRKNGGFTDTNVNGADFVAGTPNPRRTTPIVEIGPYVLSVDPRRNVTTAPRDANITVNFTEAVTVEGNWYHISCANTGLHNDATIGGGGLNWIIVPNVNFQPGEVCTLTIFANAIHDADLDDVAPNTDTLRANYTWSFTVATGAAPQYGPEVHLTMGNPTDAETNVETPTNYLMLKPEYSLSYNRDRGTPNWVSWHLDDTWIGSLARVDTFRADSAVPSDWYRVLSTDYFGSGFDRGHMVPNADRDPETSVPINQATFLMTNMIPQAPDNNQGPWAAMENYLRTLLPANEIYIVAGGSGIGGSGSSGFMSTFANGHVTVPATTWKAALVIPKASGDDVSRVTAAARTIAVIMPNTQGIRNVDWQSYLVTVDAVEALSGYDLFENLPDAIENAIEAGVNGVNPPGVEDQSFSVGEDDSRTFTIDAASASNTLTYTIVTAPEHGTLSGSGASQTYTPAPDFNGTDTFTFRVSDGTRQSNVATMTITVLEGNDAPVASNDAGSTNEDQPVQFATSTLTANDSTGPANESNQSLSVASVTATAETNGTVSLDNGVVTYMPAPNFYGVAGFTYSVCDDGVTGGLTSPLCTTATVTVNVASVNDAPSATITVAPNGNEGSAVTATVAVGDADAGDTFNAAWTVTKNGVPFASGSGNSITFTPDDDGSYAVSVVVTDGAGATASDAKSVAVSNVAPVIGTVSGPVAQISVGAAAPLSVTISDAGTADTHTATFTWGDGATSTATCAAGVCSAAHPYATAGIYNVSIVVADDDGGAATTTFASVVVFDANAGHVTGGGWFTTSSGKANVNVTVKYQNGAATPTGNVKFDAGSVKFESASFDWLVVSGTTAQLRGTGTVNGSGSYVFTATVVDASTDLFRIRIWNAATNVVVYDTVAPQQLGGGNLTIHKAK